MFSSSLKIIFRTLLRKKGYSFINISGVAIGLARWALIGLYIFDEWRVDRFHKNGDRLFRVTTDVITAKGDDRAINSVGRPLAQTIKKEVPEVEHVIPMRRYQAPIKHNGQQFYEKIFYAGEQYPSAFSLPLIEGQAATVLQQPYTAIIKNSIARKYFGNGSAIGKIITIRDSVPITVSGVVDDHYKSHVEFDVLLSWPTYAALGGTSTEWFTWDESCFVLLHPNANVEQAQKKISSISMRYNGDEYKNAGYNVGHSLKPVPDIYLYDEQNGVSRAEKVYILGGIGIFILLLACINFVNLSTARQAERAKEVGVRKTIGAGYSSLIGHFITESIVLVFLSGLIAAGIVILMLPYVNHLTEKNISAGLLLHPYTIGLSVFFLLLTGLLSGWYPALLLARFRPVDTLKTQVVASGGNSIRKVLVVFQFSISLLLIISTIVASKQLKHMQQQELGFNSSQLMVVDLRKTPRAEFIENYASIKNELSSLASVQSVTGTAALPGRSGWDGQLVWAAGRPAEDAVTLEVIPVDHDYVKTLGLKIISGRDYSRQFSTDETQGMLLNEAACKLLGWNAEEAVGKRISTSGADSGIVIGVLSDYHQHGLQQNIKAIATFMAPYAYGYLGVKFKNVNLSQAVKQVESYWVKRFPGYPFEYTFLDEDFQQQYKAEQRMAVLFKVFSGIAILIACLGLFGLATFTAEKRKKEVGIRKVLGASVNSIVLLLSKEFLVLVGVALLIASPVAWYFMNGWLQDFAYRISIPVWVFFVAGILAITIALITVSFQALKAALSNPVKNLRTE